MIFIVSGERRVLYVTKGEDRTVRMVVRDKDTGEIVDLDGQFVQMTIRRKPSDGIPLVSRMGVPVGPSTDGTVDFDLVQADWLTMEPRRYVWDVWLTGPLPDQPKVQIVPLSDFVLQKSATAASDTPTSPTPSEIVAFGLPDPGAAAAPSVLFNNPAGTVSWEPGVPVPNPALIPDGKSVKTLGGALVFGDEVDPEVPDPSGEPDGKFLKTLSGALVYGDETDPEVPNPSGEPDNRPLKTLGGVLVYGQAIPPSSTVGYVLTTQPVGTLTWSPLTTSARLTFAAGVTGLADQVAIVNPAIFGFRITEVKFHCDSGIVGATVALQSGATVPGLVDITERFDFSAFFDGYVDETVPSYTRTVPNAQLLYLYRSDDRVAGSVIVTLEVI